MPLHGLCVLFVALVESEICIWGLAQRKGLSGTDTIEKGTYGGMFFHIYVGFGVESRVFVRGMVQSPGIETEQTQKKSGNLHPIL